MKFFGTNLHRSLVISLLLISAAIAAAPAQDPRTQASPTREDRILLTAVDKDRHFVKSLRREDLRFLEDGKPQEITSLELLTDQSASIAILIDASFSQEQTLPAQKLAATSFVEAIIRPARDKAAVATFTGTLTIEQPLTDDETLLRQAIARAKVVPPPGYIGGGVVVGRLPPAKPNVVAGSTAVWDSVVAACEQLLSQSNEQTRHAIVLLSDGEDTNSKTKMADAIARAIRENAAIYSIGIGDTYTFGINKDALRKLSERTGGSAFFPKRVSDLPAIFTEIGEELRTQYLVVYGSSRGAGFSRKIEVEIVNPALRSSGIQLSYPRIAPGK